MAKSSNKSVVPEAREALDRFKMEAASDVGVQSLINEIIQHIVQPMAIKSI
ncbi:MAG: small, acid-soluble spore protein, alpha/beta type [Clostridia bacterium]|nr:small, acid-soluble spore protein, alpha/beta type [Clostridia bacterium]MBQ7046849.1 small, acid-soluble spore protein, alpha/beta type [Oscillospiraceae bacterium]